MWQSECDNAERENSECENTECHSSWCYITGCHSSTERFTYFGMINLLMVVQFYAQANLQYCLH